MLIKFYDKIVKTVYYDIKTQQKNLFNLYIYQKSNIKMGNILKQNRNQGNLNVNNALLKFIFRNLHKRNISFLY